MPLVVGVTFRKVGKVYYFDPGELELKEGDFVIAETARGIEFGEVVLEPREVPEEDLVAPLKKIIRKATEEDLEREASNREKEQQAFEICEQKIAAHNLPMKLLEAEYAFDGSQVTFSFSADGRVDFRELVKDVASTLKTKVQLHQIGVRDEAKLIGGYGTCGRPLCCATFLSSFEPISMKMAKDQSLFLNPAKFSGCCGKLMCCLRYEHEFYKYAQKRFPAVGAILQLENGRGKVIDVNMINGMLTIETEEEVVIHVHASQLNLEGLCRKHGIACNMSDKSCQPLLAGDYEDIPQDEEEEDADEDYEAVWETYSDDAAFDDELDEQKADQKRYQRPRSNGVIWREPKTEQAEVNLEDATQQGSENRPILNINDEGNNFETNGNNGNRYYRRQIGDNPGYNQNEQRND